MVTQGRLVPGAFVIRDFIGSMMAYEAGQMTHGEVVAFYQYLIDRDLVPKLHHSYGRIARILIERGECRPSQPA